MTDFIWKFFLVMIPTQQAPTFKYKGMSLFLTVLIGASQDWFFEEIGNVFVWIDSVLNH